MFLLTLPEKLLPQPPDLLLCQDISRFCRILKKFIVSSISLEEFSQFSHRNTAYKEAIPL